MKLTTVFVSFSLGTPTFVLAAAAYDGAWVILFKADARAKFGVEAGLAGVHILASRLGIAADVLKGHDVA